MVSVSFESSFVSEGWDLPMLAVAHRVTASATHTLASGPAEVLLLLPSWCKAKLVGHWDSQPQLLLAPTD